MTWVLVIALALAAFALLIALRLPRSVWAAAAASLAVGLAGYAFQGSPSLGGAPAQVREDLRAPLGEQIVELRREVMLEENWGDRTGLITADAMTRRGRFESAAILLRGHLDDNPRDAEGWLALGNTLIAQANGSMTPAARLAYRRVETLAPGDPAVPFFLGLSELQNFRMLEARSLWAEALGRTEEGSEERAAMEERLARLDELLRRIVEQQQGQIAAPPAN